MPDCAHVIRESGANEVYLVLPSSARSRLQAEIVAVTPEFDLAALAVDSGTFRTSSTLFL